MSPEVIVTVFLSLLSGVVIGFTLGMVGGGGSILAVPLLIYVVGISNTHIAIGTSALAVAANSIVNLLYHKRKGHVNLKQEIFCNSRSNRNYNRNTVMYAYTFAKSIGFICSVHDSHFN